MVDGVMLLVDASEGPLPQTRFVLRKALERRLTPIVVINKIDRPDARAAGSAERDLRPVHRSRRQRGSARFPGALHQRARRHRHASTRTAPGEDLRPLFDAIVEHVPPPRGNPDAPLQLLVANLDSSDYLGRIAIGRIFNGRVKIGDAVAVVQARHRGSADEGHQALRLRRPEAHRHPGGRRRRHRLPRRHRGHHDRRDDHRHGAPDRDPADRDRRADGVDDLRRQHVADGRPRRAVRHVAPAEGSARPRAARQRVDPHRADRHAGADEGGRPRRAAAVDSDRDDAPRGVRAAGVASRHRHQGRSTARPSSRSRS